MKDVRDKRQVSDGDMPADEPLLLGEDALEHAEHAEDLLLVALDRARDLLLVVLHEPHRLAEVRPVSSRSLSARRTAVRGGIDAPLAGGLEEEPLDELELLVHVRDAELVLLVIVLDEVQQDRVRFPATRMLPSKYAPVIRGQLIHTRW